MRDHNLSIIAFDAETNIPIGVMLNGVFHREELEVQRSEVCCMSFISLLSMQNICILQVIESCVDSKFVPIALMLHEVQIRSKEYFMNNDIQSTFDLKVLIV